MRFVQGMPACTSCIPSATVQLEMIPICAVQESERETAETAAPTSRGAQALPPCGPAPHASANGARDLPQGGVAASGHLPDTRDAADGDRSATLAAAVLGGIKEVGRPGLALLQTSLRL